MPTLLFAINYGRVAIFGVSKFLDNGPVHLAYNPSFSAGTIFFSRNKSANNVFQLAYQHSQTWPITLDNQLV
jgi:hypothetical protein